MEVKSAMFQYTNLIGNSEDIVNQLEKELTEGHSNAEAVKNDDDSKV